MKYPRICILRVGGTNCDLETKAVLDHLETKTDVVHLNKMNDEKLMGYAALVIPGGFSYGDYVRAGAIFAKRIKKVLAKNLAKFVEEGRPVLGICNGFQVLVECGLLPAFDGISDYPQTALAINGSAKYECRWIYLSHQNHGKCIFTRNLEQQKIFVPVAHAEGRFVFRKEVEEEYFKKLANNDQLVFRYCDESGAMADGRYPINPNGSFKDIAGICDPSGIVLGLMPHPERASWKIQLPNWTAVESQPEHADGMSIFKSLVDYLRQ